MGTVLVARAMTRCGAYNPATPIQLPAIPVPGTRAVSLYQGRFPLRGRRAFPRTGESAFPGTGTALYQRWAGTPIAFTSMGHGAGLRAGRGCGMGRGVPPRLRGRPGLRAEVNGLSGDAAAEWAFGGEFFAGTPERFLAWSAGTHVNVKAVEDGRVYAGRSVPNRHRRVSPVSVLAGNV